MTWLGKALDSRLRGNDECAASARRMRAFLIRGPIKAAEERSRKGEQAKLFEHRDVRVIWRPPFGEHRRGLFEHTDVLKKRPCWGVLLSGYSFLHKQERVTRRRRKPLKQRAAQKPQ